MTAHQPFFVFGNPRSGTSLFRLMLNSHPKIAVPPECGFAEWLYEKFGQGKFSKNTYRNFCAEVFETRKFKTWGLSHESLLSEIIKKKPKNYKELVREVYLEYARKAGKNVDLFGDKNNYYIKKIGKIESIFPGSKKIFIVRDGRDVACSYLMLRDKKIDSVYKPSLTSDIREIATEWRESVEVMEYWFKKGALSIRYEDLVVRPAYTLAKVCNYLSIEYSINMLGYYNKNDEPDEFKAWKGKTFEPLDQSGLKKFKAELTNEQINIFQEVAGSSLVSLGYGLE